VKLQWILSILSLALLVAVAIQVWLWLDVTGELARTQVELSDTQAELSAVETELNSTTEEYEQLLQLLETLTAAKGYRNPAYDEAMSFITTDLTDRYTYSENFTCRHFAATFNENAESTGFRCAFVYIGFLEGSAHAICAFETVDRGLIYVDPQTDELIPLSIDAIGAKWNDLCTGYSISGNPTIDEIIVIW